MRPITRTWLVAISVTLFVLLIIVGMMSYRTIGQLQESALVVKQTHEALDSLERLVVTLKDAETGQRCFLLTGDETYLAPYRVARNRQAEEVAHITRLFARNQRLEGTTAQLATLTAAKFSELAETVKLQREGHADAALDRVRSGQGREMMEELQSLVNQLEEEQRELLTDQQWAHVDASRDASVSVVAMGFVISAVLAGFTWSLRPRASHAQRSLTAA
jgi:CHASE3 domain sensor protein